MLKQSQVTEGAKHLGKGSKHRCWREFAGTKLRTSNTLCRAKSAREQTLKPQTDNLSFKLL